MVLIYKDFDRTPASISAIETKNLEKIQDWLNEVQVTYTAGSLSVNWKVFMENAKNDPRFYFDTTEDGERKPVGWFELTEDAAVGSDEETEEGESSYDESGSSSESESDDSDDSEESFEDEESEGSYDEEAEDDLEEEGMDWDDMHRDAARSDRKRETRDDDRHEEEERSKKSRGGPPPKKSRR